MVIGEVGGGELWLGVCSIESDYTVVRASALACYTRPKHSSDHTRMVGIPNWCSLIAG